MKKILNFVPLFLIVLIVYNIVIFSKPEWLLEPELFDTTHSLTQAPIPAGVTPPATVAPPVESAPAVAAGEPEVPEEFAAEYIDISARPIASISMPSGVKWKPIASDVLLLFAVLVLYAELYKTTRMGSLAKFEHFISFLVFLIFLAEFLMIRQCATSAFGIVMLLSLVDVIGGIAISMALRPKKA